MRDRLVEALEELREDPEAREDPIQRDYRRKQQEELTKKLEELRQSIRWNQQAYVATGRKRRLALRKIRTSKRVSIETLAKAGDGVPRKTDLIAYESGRVGLPQVALEQVLAALTRECGEPITLDALDLVARELKDVHLVSETTTWGRYPERKLMRPSLVVFDPETHELEIGRSNTRVGPMTVDYLRVRQDTAMTPGNLRILNAKHPGLELTILIRGRARFTLTRQPLPAESLEDRGFHPPGEEEGLVLDRIFHPGDIAIFDSGLYHRFEALCDEVLVVSINLGGSIDLARVMGPIVERRRPSPPNPPTFGSG
jgi:hypothetical protein